MVTTIAYHVVEGGDRNTKYFQSKAVWRERKNKIRELTDSVGVVHSDLASMWEVANSYFHDIFTADPTLNAAPILELINPVVTEEDNTKLCAPFTDKEISDALFQIGPLKAPGPDGFPARFFKRNWNTLKEGVLAAVKDFFQHWCHAGGSEFYIYCTYSLSSQPGKNHRLHAH